jgi:hypothetical protein
MRVGRRRRAGAGLFALALSLAVGTDATALTWTGDTPLSGSGSAWVYGGGMAVSSTTTAHSVYEQYVDGEWQVLYRRTGNSGTSWTAPIVLSRLGVNEGGTPAIDAYTTGVNAVWLEGDDIIGTSDAVVVHRRSGNTGQTWTAPQQLSPPLEAAGIPRVARTGSRVGVVWTNERTGTIWVRMSSDGGATWKARIALATTTRAISSGVYEGYAAIAVSGSNVYVAYYSASKTLKLRRSTDGGATWKTAITISTTGSGYNPAVAASGAYVLVGYAVRTSTDIYTAMRRSSNAGSTWGSVVQLSPASSYPSFEPSITYRSGFRVGFEKCTSNSCSQSAVMYRSSSTGATWGTTVRVTPVHRAYSTPGDLDVAGKILVQYVTYDNDNADVWVRRGA